MPKRCQVPDPDERPLVHTPSTQSMDTPMSEGRIDELVGRLTGEEHR